MLKLLKTVYGPHTWCRHVILLRTNLRLCHKGSAQSALQDHQVEGTYNSQSRCDQSNVQYHQEGLVYDHQSKFSQSELQNDREVNYSTEVETNTESHQPNVTRTVGKFQDEQAQRYLLRPDQPPDARVLRVAILGAPNAGKSTLVNNLLTWKVNPVSSKVHTTRKNSFGVFTEGNTQIVFTDTPGVITPAERKKHYCERSLLVDPKRSVEEVDLIGVLVDVANRFTRGALHHEILKILKNYQHIPSVLILNKVDELKKQEVLLELINTLTEGLVGGVKVPATPVRRPKKKKTEKAYQMIGKLDDKYGKSVGIEKKDWESKESEKSGFKPEGPNESVPESVDGVRGKRFQNWEKTFESTDTELNKLDLDDTSVDYYSVTTGSEQSLKNEEASNNGNTLYDSLKSFKENREQHNEKQKVGSSYERLDDANIAVHKYPTEHLDDKAGIAKDEEVFDSFIKDFKEEKTLDKFKQTESENYEILTSKSKLFESGIQNEMASPMSDKTATKKIRNDFFPNKDTSDSSVETKQDLSKYVTPWDELMPLHREVRRGWPHFDRVFIVSSLYGDGMEDLKAYFLDKAVRGDWAFHSSLVTDEDPHELAKLIVWSKLLDHLKGYVAYQLEPDIAYWKYEEDITLKIVMNLNVKHVDRVIGPGGLIIRKIAEKSQQSLMDAFRCEVALKLVVRKKRSYRR